MYEQLSGKILKIIGLSRGLTPIEKKYIATWKEEYRFKDEIILEAAKRGVKKNGKDVSFAYLNGILSNWKKNEVSGYLDIIALDEKFYKKGDGAKKTVVNKNSVNIVVKHLSESANTVECESDGKWLALAPAGTIELGQGEFRNISLGISVEIPAGYEMVIALKDNIYSDYGITQTNGISVLDASSSDKVIEIPIKADRNICISTDDMLWRARITKKQPPLNIINAMA